MQWKEFRSHLAYLSSADQSRVEKAFAMSKKAHEGQKRISGDDYFTHPLAVADTLADLHADADTIIAALLHDAVEDTPMTLDEIDVAFNGNVRVLIDGVTKLSKADIEEKPTLDEQTESLRKMFTLMQEDIRIMVIKLADRLHNMQTAEFLPPDRQQALARETMDFYVKIADRLSMQDMRDELEALCLATLEPENFRALQSLRLANEKEGKKYVQAIQKAVRNAKTHLPNVHVLLEPSTWKRLQEQKGVGQTAISGVATHTVAIVVNAVDDCYRTMGILHQNWQREILSFQDFINRPTINGYQGIHTTLIVEGGTRVRCKIRTTEMQDYARSGITEYCFGEDPEVLSRQLLWMERIPTLAEDTAQRSAEFWQSLQSDILGESITIHGPADEAVLIPTESTVLDGAFYCIRQEAIHVKKILLNGKEVLFATPLHNAASINFELSNRKTVQREWLALVRTGFATAQIRSALGQEPEHKKMQSGKALLQKALDERRQGFVEEFGEERIAEAAGTIGFASLVDAYAAIAEGHLDPAELVQALISQKERRRAKDEQSYTIRYHTNPDDMESITEINKINKELHPGIQEIRYRYWPMKSKGAVRMNIRIKEEEKNALLHRLHAAGAQNVTAVAAQPSMKYLMGIVIFFWALNPVAAKMLLSEGMTPMTLLTVRLLVTSILTFGFYMLWRLFRREKLSPITNIYALTAAPAALTILLAWFTYAALEHIPPSVHLTIMRFNALLLPFGYLAARKKSRNILLLLCAIFFAGVLSAFLQFSVVISGIGMLFSVLALIAYVVYSTTVERTMQKYKIGLRYPSFLVAIGAYLGVAGVALLFTEPANAIWTPLTLPAIFYVFFCVFLPHACFHLALERRPFSHITDLFLLEVPLAIIFEVVLLGIVLDVPIYLLIILVLSIVVFFRWRTFRSNTM